MVNSNADRHNAGRDDFEDAGAAEYDDELIDMKMDAWKGERR